MSEPVNGTATRWKEEISRYERAFDAYKARCEKIRKIYRKAAGGRRRRFSILWSNIQTLQPAVYARVPSAVVSRRFKDADPVARTATEVLERATNYSLDAFGFDQMMRAVRDDYLLDARGTAWVRYEPVMREVRPEIGASRQDVETGNGTKQEWRRDDDGELIEDESEITQRDDGSAFMLGDPVEELEFERVGFDYVHRDDFGHSAGRFWGEVWAVWRKAYLTRDECVKRFGDELGKRIPLDHKPAGARDETDTERERTCKATIYEIWSKRDRKVYFVSRDMPDVLAEEEPFLKLKDFWPCPKPAYGTLTTDELVPIPDYIFYQDQAEEIDDLTAKIATLEKSLKLAGFYPSGPSGDGTDAIRTAMGSHDLEVTLVPVKGWAQFSEKGGASQIQWVPLGQVVQALDAAVALRDKMIGDVYQITGISDIVRGESNPNETATAQGIKAQWGSIRIRDRQQELARFARDVIQIVAECIAEKFAPETLQEMTGIPLVPQPAEMPPMMPGMPPEAMQQAQQQLQDMQAQEQAKQAVVDLLRNDASRSFRVDVESDSTVEGDENEERQRRTEFLTSVTQFVAGWTQVLPMMPQLAPMAGQLLLFGIRGFRVGRELEETVEKAMDQLSQMGQPQQQGPDPAQQAAQAKAEMDGKKAELDLQATQAKTEATVTAAQASIAKTQADTQAHQIKAQTDIERMQVEAATRAMQPPEAMQ